MTDIWDAMERVIEALRAAKRDAHIVGQPKHVEEMHAAALADLDLIADRLSKLEAVAEAVQPYFDAESQMAGPPQGFLSESWLRRRDLRNFTAGRLHDALSALSPTQSADTEVGK